MSTQYSVVNTRITEEVAEFQKKVSAIRAECLLIVDYIQTACSDVINRIVPQVFHNRFTTLNKK